MRSIGRLQNGETERRSPNVAEQAAHRRAHTKRNAHLFSILLANIVNNNLITMLIAEAPADGYLAYQKLKNHCWQEPATTWP